MKELEQNINTTPKIEVSVKKQQQIEHQLIGNIIPHDGHIIWQINTQTLEIEKAKFSNATYVVGEENKREIIKRDGFTYVSALNKKNAIKKFNQGRNGSVEINNDPLKINIF